MKKLFYFLILSLFCLSLHAQGLGQWTPAGFEMDSAVKVDPIVELKKAKEMWNLYGKNVNLKEYDEKLTYMYTKTVDRAPCFHCPEYLKLSEAVNKAIKAMPVKDVTEANLVTIRSNELEFLYVINRYEYEDGRIDCKKFNDSNPMREYFEGKKEGRYKVLTKTVAEMTGIGDVQFLNPELGEVYYYYRGKGAKSNFIYEVRGKKDRPYEISVYEYLPTEKEKNPYNLPDLGGGPAPKPYSGPMYEVANENQGMSVDDDPNNYMNFEFRMEKRGKFLPKDLHFFQAGTEASLLDLAKLKSTTKLSIKDRSTKWSLTPMDSNDEYIRFELRHKGIDELGTKITVPYKVVLDKATGKNLTGSISEEIVHENGGINPNETHRTLSLVLTDHDLEVIRMDARKNNAGEGLVSIGHGRRLGPAETLSISGGYRESKESGSATFIGVQHAKKIKENTSMVLDLKFDTQTKGTIMWQVHHKF